MALQGEHANKTIAIQTEKQRRRIKSALVAPEPAQDAGAASVRKWWVYDSRAATKQRVVLPHVLPAADIGAGGTVAETGACAPLGSNVPRAPHQLATMASMASVRK